MSESVDVYLEKIRKVYPLIKSVKGLHKGKNWSGVMRCPVCEGDLKMVHCTNGHTHGQCATEGCVGWHE